MAPAARYAMWAAGMVLLAGLAALLASTQAGAWLLLYAMEDHAPPIEPAAARQAQAIVVVGGRTDRVHEAARLGRLTGLPILATGRGTGDFPFDTESEKMDWILRTQYGMQARWLETRSTNTHENAVESWCLLAPQGVRRIVLVTDSGHMLRARWEFEAAGFTVLRDVIAAPARPWPGAAGLRPGRAGLEAAAPALADWAELAFTLLDSILHPRPQCGADAATSPPA